MLTHCLPMPAVVALMRWIYSNQSKFIYLKNQKLFVNILMHFSNLHRILKFFLKNLSSIAELFSKLFTVKNVDSWMHSRSCFRTSVGSQRVNESHTLQDSAKVNFFSTFSSLWTRKMFKTSLLVRFEIVGLYVYQLSAHTRYYRFNISNLPQPIQMRLS